VLPALCVLAVGLTACQSSSPPAADATVAGAATTAPTTPPGATPALVTPPSAAARVTAAALVGGVAADDLCAFLASDLPRLQDQAKVGTLARLAADLADWYALQGLPRPDGAVIDQATQRACPDIRTAALVAVGQSDLRSL
jgi:hypothetical protein